MIVRCKECKTEITSSPKPQGCGCPNQLIVHDDQVSANDLGKVIMVENHNKDKESSARNPYSFVFMLLRKKHFIFKISSSNRSQ